jgi:hypothetical protein
MMRASPEVRSFGRNEQPARSHAPQPPKPPAPHTKTERQIAREIGQRLDELRPLVNELPRLDRAERLLRSIK